MNFFFIKFLYTLLFFISIQIATAQVTGKVVDTEDKYPLEYASVAIYDTSSKKLVAGVVTDKEGFFSISNINSGNYYLEASFLGYQAYTIKSIVLNSKGESKDFGILNLVLGRNHLFNYCRFSNKYLSKQNNII